MIFAAAKWPPRSIAMTPVVVAWDAAAPIEEQHLAVVDHVQGLTLLIEITHKWKSGCQGDYCRCMRPESTLVWKELAEIRQKLDRFIGSPLLRNSLKSFP
jgi:hypothetical protein